MHMSAWFLVIMLLQKQLNWYLGLKKFRKTPEGSLRWWQNYWLSAYSKIFLKCKLLNSDPVSMLYILLYFFSLGIFIFTVNVHSLTKAQVNTWSCSNSSESSAEIYYLIFLNCRYQGVNLEHSTCNRYCITEL